MAVIFAVNGVLLGLAINWVTGEAPRWLEPYRWPALVLFTLLAAAAAIIGVVNPGSGGRTDPLVRRVTNLRRHNPDFTGRAADLNGIRRNLLSTHAVALVAQPWRSDRRRPDAQALYGMAGVGKTELAVEYAHRASSSYDIVWWVNAERREQIGRQLAKLGDRLLLPTPRDGDWVSAVKSELDRRERWLLVFDNARDPAVIHQFMPGSPAGHVIITSRNPDWSGIAHPLRVDVFTPEDAREFLTRRLHDASAEQVDRLAEELGWLPLALAQAAAYINQNSGLTVDDYLRLYRQSEPAMLKRGQVNTYPHTVDTTFRLSFTQLGRESPAACQLLYLYAFLAPDGIPASLAKDGAALLPRPLRDAAADELTLNDTLMNLREFSLIDQDDGGPVRVHRLVQATVRGMMSDKERREWLSRARAVVGAALNAIDPSDPRAQLALQQHLDAVAVQLGRTDAR
jgi:hypothetical protein